MQNPLFTIIVQKTGKRRYKVLQIDYNGKVHQLANHITWEEVNRRGYIAKDSLEWLM